MHCSAADCDVTGSQAALKLLVEASKGDLKRAELIWNDVTIKKLAQRYHIDEGMKEVHNEQDHRAVQSIAFVLFGTLITCAYSTDMPVSVQHQFRNIHCA